MSDLLDDLQSLNDLCVSIGQLNVKLKRHKYGTDNYFELLKEIDKLNLIRIKTYGRLQDYIIRNHNGS